MSVRECGRMCERADGRENGRSQPRPSVEGNGIYREGEGEHEDVREVVRHLSVQVSPPE